MLWVIPVLSGCVIQKHCKSIVFFTYGEHKPCLYLEMDTKTQVKESITQEKEHSKISGIQKDEEAIMVGSE